jgi:hypothetical protein
MHCSKKPFFGAILGVLERFLDWLFFEKRMYSFCKHYFCTHFDFECILFCNNLEHK